MDVPQRFTTFIKHKIAIASKPLPQWTLKLFLIVIHTFAELLAVEAQLYSTLCKAVMCVFTYVTCVSTYVTTIVLQFNQHSEMWSEIRYQKWMLSRGNSYSFANCNENSKHLTSLVHFPFQVVVFN